MHAIVATHFSPIVGARGILVLSDLRQASAKAVRRGDVANDEYEYDNQDQGDAGRQAHCTQVGRVQAPQARRPENQSVVAADCIRAPV